MIINIGFSNDINISLNTGYHKPIRIPASKNTQKYLSMNDKSSCQNDRVFRILGTRYRQVLVLIRNNDMKMGDCIISVFVHAFNPHNIMSWF